MSGRLGQPRRGRPEAKPPPKERPLPCQLCGDSGWFVPSGKAHPARMRCPRCCPSPGSGLVAPQPGEPSQPTVRRPASWPQGR